MKEENNQSKAQTYPCGFFEILKKRIEDKVPHYTTSRGDFVYQRVGTVKRTPYIQLAEEGNLNCAYFVNQFRLIIEKQSALPSSTRKVITYEVLAAWGEAKKNSNKLADQMMERSEVTNNRAKVTTNH